MFARTLYRATEAAWLACAGLVLSAAAGAEAPAHPSQTAAATASFRPTATQLAGLKIVTVGTARFRTERETDGKIALNADRTTPVFSPYSGRVMQVLAGPGDVVKPGQRLLAVQASEFVQGQNDLLAARAGMAAARSQLATAQKAEQRKHALLEAKAGSKQDWEQSQNDLAAAESAYRTSEALFAAVRNRLKILGKTDAEIEALANAETMDAVAYVVAPIGGTVTDRQVGPGQYVQSGASTPVFTVGDLASVWLVANVREADAPYVHKGQEVEVRTVALPDRTFTARISHVAAALDPATHRLAVRADVANPEGLLKPEMFARFSIISSAGVPSPAVPESGVVYEGSEAHVWVLGTDGTLYLRKIRAGRSARGQLEVLEGIQAGEKVVASGALFIDRAAQSE